jgi:citrate lyase subunit beta/citryl-CoA lyase
MQFIPGNNPGMVQNGGVLGADSIILDVEDAITLGEKDAARLLVASALTSVNFYKSEKVVRINSIDTFAQEDIRVIVPCRPDALLIPKVHCPEDVLQVVEWVKAAEKPGQEPVKLIPQIESPQGVIAAYAIAVADKRVEALALGAEDYTATLVAQRTKEGTEILTMRTVVVNAAAAAGVQSIDTPFTDVNDEEGLIRDTALAKQLGFKGKLSINPRHIDIIHRVFSPTAKEVEWALRVVAGLKKAAKEGAGVITVDGKMVDKPIVDRAERVVQLAKTLGILKEAAQ